MIKVLKGVSITFGLVLLFLVAAMLGAPTSEEIETERAAAEAERAALVADLRTQEQMRDAARRQKVESCAFTEEEIFSEVQASVSRQLLDPRSVRWDAPTIEKKADQCEWRIDGFARARNDNGIYVTVGYGAVVIDGLVVAAGIK